MLKTIKNKYGHYVLNKEYKNKRKSIKFMNLNDAQSIGIIFNASKKENMDFIINFVKEIKNSSKEIKLLGFINNKQQDNFYNKFVYCDFFNLKDINWYGKPQKEKITDFINTNFDILIDLNLDDITSLDFVLVSSQAKFKVGKLNKTKNNYYDLSLDIPEEKSVLYMIEQTKIYLKMIKTN